jgi:hypothetical protein
MAKTRGKTHGKNHGEKPIETNFEKTPSAGSGALILGLAPELPEWRQACERVMRGCQKFLGARIGSMAHGSKKTSDMAKPWENGDLYSNYVWLVVWNMTFMTFHILGILSSQLTNSYFSEG